MELHPASSIPPECKGAVLYHAHIVDLSEDETEARLARLRAMDQPAQRQGYIREWIHCGIQQECKIVIPDPHASSKEGG